MEGWNQQSPVPSPRGPRSPVPSPQRPQTPDPRDPKPYTVPIQQRFTPIFCFQFSISSILLPACHLSLSHQISSYFMLYLSPKAAYFRIFWSQKSKLSVAFAVSIKVYKFPSVKQYEWARWTLHFEKLILVGEFSGIITKKVRPPYLLRHAILSSSQITSYHFLCSWQLMKQVGWKLALI